MEAANRMATGATAATHPARRSGRGLLRLPRLSSRCPGDTQGAWAGIGGPRLALAGVALAAVAGLTAGCGRPAASAGPPSTAEQEAGMASGLPLRDPPVLDASSSANHKLRLVAAPTRFALAGRAVWGRSYNRTFVGPTLHFEPGEHVKVTLVDHMKTPTNLHYHGMEVSPSGHSDNVFLTDPPGHSLRYHLDIAADHPQGTFWYHDHQMCMRAESMSMPATPASSSSSSSHPSCLDSEGQVFSGLSGTIVVGDDRSLLPPDLRHITAHTLVFKDVQIDRSGHIVAESIDSNNPTVRLVNGELRPALTMRPGETQLWRLANEGADIFYDLRLDGYSFTVIGEDGVPVAHITTASTLLLPPAKRYDVLVTAGPRPGDAWLRTLAYSNGPQGDSYPDTTLMKLQVAGAPAQPVAMPTGAMPTAPANLASAPIAQLRTVTLSENSAGTAMYVNAKQFDPNRSVFSTPALVGTVEEWTVLNESGEIHPFHVHTNHFQVISVNGTPKAFTAAQGIVPVPAKHNGVPGQVVIRIAFTYPGKWIFHCHILAHADAGMMSFINVVGPARPNSAAAASNSS